MSSLAVGCGLGLELWLGGLFSAAELAAAELLLQLGGDDEVASTTSSSRRSVSSWSKAGLTAEERVVEETASLELDRRARKRYRRVSDLYTTIPAMDASAAKKRRTCDGGGGDDPTRCRRCDTEEIIEIIVGWCKVEMVKLRAIIKISGEFIYGEDELHVYGELCCR
ncbi:hypothetical protein TRIUR3_31363 [Triticum urartu]|uniref:Uncharacterized protein n=1 Tax=Triticum urartu TaxID=4572 RepID=M7YQE2_TRIUA|nr:hypothetical protein TRIUR3_31363 [Triticum urartu]